MRPEAAAEEHDRQQQLACERPHPPQPGWARNPQQVAQHRAEYCGEHGRRCSRARRESRAERDDHPFSHIAAPHPGARGRTELGAAKEIQEGPKSPIPQPRAATVKAKAETKARLPKRPNMCGHFLLKPQNP